MPNQELVRPSYFEVERGDLNSALAELAKRKPDLIIEGGSNNRTVLKALVQATLQAPYIGLDLNPEIRDSKFTQYGNCFRPEHAQPLITHYNSKRPALLSYYALEALLSDRLNHEDRKDSKDRLAQSDIVKFCTQLYKVQFHIIMGSYISDEMKLFFQRSHQAGWRIRDFGQGDLILMTR